MLLSALEMEERAFEMFLRTSGFFVHCCVALGMEVADEVLEGSVWGVVCVGAPLGVEVCSDVWVGEVAWEVVCLLFIVNDTRQAKIRGNSELKQIM